MGQGAKPQDSQPPRDMEASAFAVILKDLLHRIPGAYAASLVDVEGETVDYEGQVDPFDVKVAAAHLRLVLHDVERYGALGRPRWIVIRGAQKSILARQLPDGYALVILLKRRAGFSPSVRAFSACERALAREACWDQVELGSWYSVQVQVDGNGRPQRVGPSAQPVEVLGAVVGLRGRERGYRVRVVGGGELTLVREARDCWYADAPVDESSARTALR